MSNKLPHEFDQLMIIFSDVNTELHSTFIVNNILLINKTDPCYYPVTETSHHWPHN